METQEIIDALNGRIEQLTKVRSLLTETDIPRGFPVSVSPIKPVPAKGKGMSLEGRQRIAAAQRKRWAEHHKAQRAEARKILAKPVTVGD